MALGRLLLRGTDFKHFLRLRFISFAAVLRPSSGRPLFSAGGGIDGDEYAFLAEFPFEVVYQLLIGSDMEPGVRIEKHLFA